MHVIKTGGAVVARPDAAQTIAEAWHNRDTDWVLVHGGGPQLDQALEAVQGPPEKVGGLRVTRREGADAVRRTLSLVGADLTAALRRAGVPAVQVPPEQGVMIAVPKRVPEGDLGRVGTVTALRTGPIRRILKQGKLPVVTPVGWDAEGPLNVNADEGAAMTAAHLQADRLTLATDVPAVLDGDGDEVHHLSPRKAEALVESGVAEGGMKAKLDQALEAVEAGIEQVRIGDVSAVWDDAVGTTLAREPELVVPA